MPEPSRQSGALVETRIVNPVTGEIVDLALGTDHLARARYEVVQAKRELDSFAERLDLEINRRLDMENARSAAIEDGMDETVRWEIKGKAAHVIDYPATSLGAALDALAEAGRLAGNVREKVLVPQPPTTPRVNRRELGKLLRHPDAEVRALVSGCAVETPQRRTVSVRQIGGGG